VLTIRSQLVVVKKSQMISRSHPVESTA